MKIKLFTFLIGLLTFTGVQEKINAATITAIATGNWSSTSTWDGSVIPSSNDSVVVPGFTVTVDNAFATCQGITVQDGGVLILNNNFYVCNISVKSGGKFYSSSANSSNKSLFWGALNTNESYTTALTYTAQNGNYKITVDGTGQFGGTVAGTNDGIGIFFSEFANSLTIDGTSASTKYIGRLIPNNQVENATSNNFNLYIKQNMFISLGTSAIGLSLQNNKKYTGTRNMTIYPGYKVSTNLNARFHANNANPTAVQGDFVYNIFGTLDLGTSGYDFSIYTTSDATSSAQSITVNVGNGTDYAVLKLGRGITLRKYLPTQNIIMNWNNQNSKIVLGGNGPATVACGGSYTGSAWVDDINVFPSQIRNLSYENQATNAGVVIPRKVNVTDTLYAYGYGHKMYVGAVADANAKTVNMGRLFNLNNNAYVVTGVSSPLTTVTATTLGAAGTWAKGATLTDASGNTYYCDSVGMYTKTLKFMGTSPAGTALTLGAELTGAPIEVTGNVSSTIATGQTARFSASAYVKGDLSNGTGIFYIAKNSIVGGTFSNGGTITLTGDLVTGDLINNGNFPLGAKMITLNGSFTGNEIDASLGYLQIGGTTNRTISGFTANKFAGLKLNTTGNISLNSAATVSGALTLTKGKLLIGDNNIKASSVIGGSASSYVVTGGAGKLILTTADTVAVTFPVGTSDTSYDPAIVKPTDGTTLSVKVSETLSGTPVAGVQYNSREWNITLDTVSTSLIQLTPSVLDQTVATRSTSPVIGHFADGSYTNNNDVTFNALNNTYTGTFSSFSPFVTGSNIDVTSVGDLSKGNYRIINNAVILQGLMKGEAINIFNANGQLINRIISNSDEENVQLKSGMYIIRTDNKQYKLVL